MKKLIRYIIYLILFALLIGAFIYLGRKDYDKPNKLSDQDKFSMEYPDIPKNNMFSYINANDLINFTNSDGTYLVFISYSNNTWASYYAKYLYEVLKEENIDKVYYYDIYKDRVRQSKNYQTIKELFSNYLITNDTKTNELYTPLFVVTKNGKLLYVNNETSIITSNIEPKAYWTLSQINSFKERITSNLRSL